MAAHPHLDPLNQKLADTSASLPPLESYPIPEFRKLLEQLNAHEQLPGVERKMVTVPVSGGTETWVYKPEGVKGPLPYVYLVHGGGFVAGNVNVYDSVMTDLVLRTGYAIVFPEYKLAPESKWPEQQEQCFAVLEWVLKHGKSLGVVPEKFALFGDSAAGITIFNMNLMALKKKIDIPYTIYLYAVASLDLEGKPTESRAEFWNGPYLTVGALRSFFNEYVPASVDRTSEEANLMNVSEETAKYFPPALIVTGSADVLRDEAEAFGAKLQDAGRDVAMIRAGGQLHDSAVLDITRDGPTPKAIMTLLAGALKERLG